MSDYSIGPLSEKLKRANHFITIFMSERSERNRKTMSKGILKILGKIKKQINKKKSRKIINTGYQESSGVMRTNETNQSNSTNDQRESFHKEIDTPQLFDSNSTDSSTFNMIHKNMDENTEVYEKFDSVITQMSQIVMEQRNIELHLAELKKSTHYLGQAVRKANIYEASLKLIDLWRITKKASDEKSQYYSNVIYDSLIKLGLDVIAPNPGETYNPVIHQKSDNSSTSDIVLCCNNYDWGWKIEDTVLSKAVVITSCEDTNGDN